MKNDFISLFKAFELKEQEGFNNYLQCFYSSQKSVLVIFDEIKTAIPYEIAVQSIRTAAVGNKNRLNALADLKKWFLEFLALQEIRHNTTESKFLSLEALRKRGLHDVFQQKSKQLVYELDSDQSPNLWHLFWKVRLSHINYFQIPLDRIQDYQSEMLQLLEGLDNFYISAKLQYSAELYSRSMIRQEKYDAFLLSPILESLEMGRTTSPIIKELYLPTLELTQNQSEKAYNQLKQFLIEKPLHEPLERQAILIYLLNFTTSKLRKGENTMIQESFDLYQLGINQSLFTLTGCFLHSTFLNIVNTACHLKKYDWLKDFIKTWSNSLAPSEKEDTIHFSMARIYFEKKKFDEVISLLQKVNFRNINFTLNVRLLLIRAYYDGKAPIYVMTDYNNALYLYVYRSKNIGNALRESILIFVKMFRSLLSEKSKTQLLNELEKKRKTAICYDWLKMKIEERQK